MKKLKKNRIRSTSLISILLVGLAVWLNTACQPNQEILKSAPTPDARPTATLEPGRTTIEQDVRDMQTAGFDYIYVFRRRDGGVFDKDDRRFLRENTPPETNRFVASTDKRAYTAGSSFRFSPENMKALRERFVIEDHSKPEVREGNKGNQKGDNRPANK